MATPSVIVTESRFVNLLDVVTHLLQKNFVVLHAGTVHRIFHMIPLEGTASFGSLKDIRVTYVDCSANFSLLDDDGWAWYIKKSVEGVSELQPSSVIAQNIIERHSIPNKTFVKIG